jgi:thymidylate synthase (FAD)
MNNTVELIGHYGNDEIHALSAWTSTSRELDAKKKERIPALLSQLAEAGHHTPFEKSMIHFLVRCDTASHIHLLKHRIGVSVNGESARYKEIKATSSVIPSDWPIDIQNALKAHAIDSDRLYHATIARLTPALGRARAKESARFFLTYANQLTLDVSFNFRSFVHFLGLRNKPTAQKEIRDIAANMLDLVKSIEGNPFKATIEAFKL